MTCSLIVKKERIKNDRRDPQRTLKNLLAFVHILVLLYFNFYGLI